MIQAPCAAENEIIFSGRDEALVVLGQTLRDLGYAFTTITPDSHASVNARAENALARDLAGVFGWNRPFTPDVVPHDVLTLMREARVVEAVDGRADLLRNTVRFSTIKDHIVLHSGFPTVTKDAVFFGPDTYRFVRFVEACGPLGNRVLELGCGTGAPALCLADSRHRLVMTDINPLAVRYAAINARLAGATDCEIHCGDMLAGVTGPFDTIIANPPFMIDSAHRLYRDGGHLGIELAFRMLEAALPHLAPDGDFRLYTAVPIINGRDPFLECVIPVLARANMRFTYAELDVDVYGSELVGDGYGEIDRLALIGLTAHPKGAV